MTDDASGKTLEHDEVMGHTANKSIEDKKGDTISHRAGRLS
jgi:hypothetical protein